MPQQREHDPFRPTIPPQLIATALALDILPRRRSEDTPVILARYLGRPDEILSVPSLNELKVDNVDILTLVGWAPESNEATDSRLHAADHRHNPCPEG
jgi:hypothetical protein